MKKITFLGIIMLISLFTSAVKAETYFDLTTVGGTQVMDWASVATENAKAQTDRMAYINRHCQWNIRKMWYGCKYF
ncbi:MAG: hypothetical protein QM800_04965 [Paludibacter sp.]